MDPQWLAAAGSQTRIHITNASAPLSSLLVGRPDCVESVGYFAEKIEMDSHRVCAPVCKPSDPYA